MAVLLVGDSNLFHRSRSGTSVYDMVRNATTGVACYGIWERKLCKVTTRLEDMLRFIFELGKDVMVILCLGQHDILDGQYERLGGTVCKIMSLVEKYRCELVVVELFDHTDFSASVEGYANRVAMLNSLWKQASWIDDSIQVVSTSFIRDHFFIQDLMHLNSSGMELLASALMGRINSFSLPHRCFS